MRKVSLLLLTGLLVMSFSSIALADHIRAVWADKAPVIDGVLDDAVWAKAQKATTFYTLGGGTPAKNTEVMVAWDWDALYVAFKNYISADSIKADVTADGGAVWGDDDNEIFLNPYADFGGPWFQFAVNSVPAKAAFGSQGGTVQSGFWFAEADIQKDFYVVEIMIEWDAIGFWPEAGEEWGINLTRRWAGGAGTPNEWLTWSPFPTTTFLDPAVFGTIEFVK